MRQHPLPRDLSTEPSQRSQGLHPRAKFSPDTLILLVMLKAEKLPAPSSTFIERQKKRIAAAEHTAEGLLHDAGESCSTILQRCFKRCDKGLAKVWPKTVNTVQDQTAKLVNNLTSNPLHSQDSKPNSKLVPRFPLGIVICTVLIFVGGTLINLSWDTIDANLIFFEEKGDVYIHDFYASAAANNVTIKHAYSTAPLVDAREMSRIRTYVVADSKQPARKLRMSPLLSRAGGSNAVLFCLLSGSS